MLKPLTGVKSLLCEIVIELPLASVFTKLAEITVSPDTLLIVLSRTTSARCATVLYTFCTFLLTEPSVIKVAKVLALLLSLTVST